MKTLWAHKKNSWSKCKYGIHKTSLSPVLAKDPHSVYCFVSYLGNNKVKEIEVPLKISVHSTPFVAVQFNSPSYSASLREDSPVDGSTVFTASASRPGSDTGTLEYSIVGGNLDSTFKINSANGKVTLAKSLDYETMKSFKLIIRATFKFSDGSSPDVTAETEGVVTVKDTNDNSPRFLVYKSPTKIAIESYTPSGTEVMEVNILKNYTLANLVLSFL